MTCRLYFSRIYIRHCYYNKKTFFTKKSQFVNLHTNNNSSIINRSNEEQLFAHLKFQLQRYNRIFRRDIEKTLNILRPENTKDALFLLGCFGNNMPDETPEDKIILLETFIENLEKNGFKLDISHYNIVLNSLIENYYEIDHNSWLKKLSLKSLKPDFKTFTFLLISAAQNGNKIAANDIIKIIKLNGYFFTSSLLNNLIQVAATNGDDKWRDLINSLKNSGFSPSFDTYISAMIGLSKSGSIDKVKKLYEDIKTFQSIKIINIIAILETLVENNHKQHISEIIQWINCDCDNKDDLKNIKLFAIKMIHKNHSEISITLLNYIPEGHQRIQFANQLLDELIICETPMETLINFISRLTEMEKGIIHSRAPGCAISRAIFTAYKFKKYKIARDLLISWNQNGQKLKPHYFWPLLISYRFQESEKGLITILNLMENLKVNIDIQTLTNYVVPFFQMDDPIILINHLNKCLKKISYQDLVISIVIIILNRGRFNQAIELCSYTKVKLKPELLINPFLEALNKNYTNHNLIYFLKGFQKEKPNIDWTGHILKILITNNTFHIKDSTKNLNLINELRRSNLACSHEAAEFIGEKLSLQAQSLLIDWNLHLPNVNSFTHPKDMTIKQLENHRIELASKNLNQRGILRKLLLNYCQDHDSKNASETYQEFINKFGIKSLSPGCLSAYFHLLTLDNKMDEAEQLLNLINRHFGFFIIDPYKIIDYATLLIKNNRFDDAVIILKTFIHFKKTDHETNSKLYDRNCFYLLNELANSKSSEAPKQINEMFQLLCNLKICNPKESNLIHGPLVRIHLNRKDYEKAVETFENCIEIYKKSPFQQELVHIFINEIASNSSDVGNLLDRVLEGSTEIHGFKNSISNLAIVFALEGHIETLSDLLKNTGDLISCNDRCLYYKYQQLSSKGCVKGLNNLFEAFVKRRSKDDLENIHHLIEFILDAYRINGDYEGANNILKRIREENLNINFSLQNRIKHFTDTTRKTTTEYHSEEKSTSLF